MNLHSIKYLARGLKIVPKMTMAEESQQMEENTHAATRKEGQCLKNFCKTTTIHGLSAISNSKTSLVRFLWAFSFIAACGLCIWQVCELVLKLSGNETTTTMTTKIHSELEFPILTICNSNPYSESKMREKLGSWIDYVKSNYSKIAMTTAIGKRLGGMLKNDLEDLTGDSDLFRMSKLNTSCLFFGDKCEDIIRIVPAFLGTCIVFNSKLIVKQIRPGPAFGFAATFNIMEDDYSGVPFFLDAGPGILVRIGTDVVADYHEFKTSAILAAPGTTTQIKLKKKEKIRLQTPYYDNCTNRHLINSLHGVVFKQRRYGVLRQSTPYTVDWCKKSCLLKWQMKICGCYASKFASLVESRLDKDKSNLVACNSTNNDEFEWEHNCTTMATSWFFNVNNHSCYCAPLCHETEFDLVVSNLRWPSPIYVDMLLKDIKISWVNNSSIQKWTKESIYRNIVRIEVFFDDFQVQTMKKNPAYDIVKFLSDLGGQAGLWIGASVYSLFELVSFLISYFVKPFVNNKIRKRSVRDHD